MRFSLALIAGVAPLVLAVSLAILYLSEHSNTDFQRPSQLVARQGGCVEACLNQLSGFDVSHPSFKHSLNHS
jgi:hypothetical protein